MGCRFLFFTAKMYVFFKSCMGDMHVLCGVFTYMNGWLWLNIVGNICNRPIKIVWQWVVKQTSPDADAVVFKLRNLMFQFRFMTPWRNGKVLRHFSNHSCFRKRWLRLSHVEFLWLTPYISRMPLWRKHRIFVPRATHFPHLESDSWSFPVMDVRGCWWFISMVVSGSLNRW